MQHSQLLPQMTTGEVILLVVLVGTALSQMLLWVGLWTIHRDIKLRKWNDHQEED